MPEGEKSNHIVSIMLYYYDNEQDIVQG
jgi:hypothetical protein